MHPAFEIGQLSTELLDPASWAEILISYGQTTGLAVALTDNNGNLLGACHNPQPVWSLFRKAPAEAHPACAFCLAGSPPCTAVRDALTTGSVVCVNDYTGIGHTAVPLFLGMHPIGAILAGQVFTRYPEPLPLGRVSRDRGVSSRDVWTAAQQQVPVSQKHLRVYADLLASLGRAFLLQRYAFILDRKLRQTNRRYQLLLDGSKDHALFTVDSRGFVTSWSPGAERFFGFTEAEIIGQDYRRFFTPEDVDEGIQERDMERAELSGTAVAEGWQVRKDGSRFLAEIVTARLGEDPPEYGRLLRDLTEERKTAEALLQTQKLESIGVLASGIAHDFNNLLTGILGNLSLAIERTPAEDTVRPLLETAERGSLKAAALVSQMLDYAGHRDIGGTRFDLSLLVAEILPLIESSIPKSVVLKLSLLPDLPWSEASSAAVEQIVMNLVVNAAESVPPEGGSVHVSTGVAESDAQNPHAVYLEVRDTGCGMDETIQSRMCDPFFTTKFTGRGLGLAAVSGIVRRLGAQMDVKSAPEKGSTFRITFGGVRGAPVASEPAAPEKAREAQTKPRNTGTVLAVDDGPVIHCVVDGGERTGGS
jgi:PAS domain S-box-containing protein